MKEITDRLVDIEWHMVTLRFSPQDSAYEKVGNVYVHRLGGSGSYLSKVLFVLRAARYARALHRKEMFDAAWAMMSYMLLPVMLARLNIPYALTLQEGDTYGHMFSRLRILPFLPLINRGFRGARVVQVISTYLGGWARQWGYQGSLLVIPNGVDTTQFAGSPVPHPGLVLVTTSRLVHKNALDDVIKALPLLPEARFVILGTGPEEAALKKLANTLKVDDRVVFKGFVAMSAIPAELHAADIFVRPSRSEGMGNSFIEAFAAGLPVIATQEGGIADFLFDAKRNPGQPTTGWAVDKNSPEQIAAAVQTVRSNPAQTKQVIETAKKLVQEKYEWGLIARTMREQVFARVLKKD